MTVIFEAQDRILDGVEIQQKMLRFDEFIVSCMLVKPYLV